MMVLPVAKEFDCRYLYKWFKQNCWECNLAAGECYRTAKFVELVFGLQTKTCSYHAWNVTPKNTVLDLTVEQFGFKHYDQWVMPDTVFDKSSDFTYIRHDNKKITADSDYLNKAYVWLCVFSRQLQDGWIDVAKFRMSRPELNKRVVIGFNRLNRLL